VYMLVMVFDGVCFVMCVCGFVIVFAYKCCCAALICCCDS